MINLDFIKSLSNTPQSIILSKEQAAWLEAMTVAYMLVVEGKVTNGESVAAQQLKLLDDTWNKVIKVG